MRRPLPGELFRFVLVVIDVVMPADVGTDSEYAARTLLAGGLVAFPTETVYGLGGIATQPETVARIFSAKNRPHFDPLIVHFADPKHVQPFVSAWTKTAQQLADAFWPGPLTMVVPRTDLIPDLVSSGLPTVAVRIPDHPVARKLLSSVNQPVAAPSANPFGRISPTTAQHVQDGLGDKVDYILDGGPCRVGLESTVVSLVDEPTILRPGGISIEDIERVIGSVQRIAPPANSDAEPVTAPTAPGMLERHYAPITKLVLADTLDEITEFANNNSQQRVGLLSPHPVKTSSEFCCVEVLSKRGDLVECAANFFAALRRLDAAGLDTIVALRFPERELGIALNDRLRRAAAG